MALPNEGVSHASSKERFDVLHGRLKSIHDLYIDAVFKATAAFLVVAGWVVTSASALNQLQKDPVSKWLVISGLLIYAVLFALGSHRTARSSTLIATLLQDLGYTEPEFYSDLVVTRSLAYAFAVANGLLGFVVGAYVLRIVP